MPVPVVSDPKSGDYTVTVTLSHPGREDVVTEVPVKVYDPNAQEITQLEEAINHGNTGLPELVVDQYQRVVETIRAGNEKPSDIDSGNNSNIGDDNATSNTSDTNVGTSGDDNAISNSLDAGVGTGGGDPYKDTVVTPELNSVTKSIAQLATPLKTIYLKKGASLTIPVSTYDANGAGVSSGLKWSSGKKGVATVDAKGKVKAIRKGTTKITVTAPNGKKLTITAKVVTKAKKLKKLKLPGAPTRLAVGKTAWLKLKLTPVTATNVKVSFKSNKPSVVSVDKAGRLTAKNKGNAIITVKAGGKTVKKKITVR
jgi:hypothetical protein